MPVLDVLVLPDPPDAIDLGVMNCVYVRDYLLVSVMGWVRTVKEGIGWRVEEVGAGVAADAVVACGVHADVLVDEVALDQAAGC